MEFVLTSIDQSIALELQDPIAVAETLISAENLGERAWKKVRIQHFQGYIPPLY